MFEAYKIGVRIGVVDATGGGILKVAAQFAKAQKEASAFLKTLRAVNEELRRKTSWASSAAQDFRNARREAEGYDRAARSARSATNGPGAAAPSSGMMVSNLAMAAAVNRMQQQDRIFFRGYPNLALPSDSARRIGAPPIGLLGSPSGASLGVAGGSGGIVPPTTPSSAGGFPGRGVGGMTAAGWPFGFGGGRGGGGGGSGNGGGFNFGPLGSIAGGWFLEQDGKHALGMLSGPIEEASKYQSAVARFQLYGLGDQLNAEAIKFATSMRIVGTSMTDAVNFMTEAQGVFRESGLSGSAALEGSKLAAPMLAKISFATSGLDEDSRAKIHTQSLAMLRFIEMRGGLKDAKTFNGIADAGWKAIRSSGGNVNWEQLRQFMARAGVAAQGMSNEALFGEMEPVIGELKGSTAGFALRTAYNRLHGVIRIPNQVAHELVNAGIWDKNKVVWNSNGGIKSFNGDPLANAALFDRSPTEFYEKVVRPMYSKLGLNSQDQIARENAMLFGSTGGTLFSLVDRQQGAIQRSVLAQQKTLGIDASVNVAKGTFQGQMLDYQKKVQDLQIQLGKTILPMLINGLRWLNPILEKAASWIGQHSTLTKGLVIAFAAFAGLAMISGSVMMIAGAFGLISTAITAGGGLAAGLTGIAGGLSALGPAIAVAASAILGWKIGSEINSHFVDGTKFGDWLGSAEAHTMAFFGNKEAKDAVAAMDKADKATHIHVHVDGRQVAHAVVPHMADMAAKPQTGMSAFDSSMFPAAVGLNYGH